MLISTSCSQPPGVTSCSGAVIVLNGIVNNASQDQRRFSVSPSVAASLISHPFSLVNSFCSLQMFGMHEAITGPWIFQFIPIKRHSGGEESCYVTCVKTLSDLAGENLNRVRCDKCSNGWVKGAEWKRNYHLQGIKCG